MNDYQHQQQEPLKPNLNPPALEIRGLSVAYGRGGSAVEVLHRADLRLERGHTLALVGQSGSGKSTLAQAAGGLLPANGRITAGTVIVGGQDVTAFSRRSWQIGRAHV